MKKKEKKALETKKIIYIELEKIWGIKSEKKHNGEGRRIWKKRRRRIKAARGSLSIMKKSLKKEKNEIEDKQAKIKKQTRTTREIKRKSMQ